MPKYVIEIDVPVTLPLECLKEIEQITQQIVEKYLRQCIHVTWRVAVEKKGERQETVLLQY